ncbi:MAG TPA: sulfotransferase [Cyclobacteriaceae bacterium]|nr:sulfotransferase [Cyclobacteriaceae bacterium]
MKDTGKPESQKLIPVQIIGIQRSGSNLLRLILNQLEGVFAPHPPHILKTFYPLLPYYGDITNEKSFRILADDICRFVRENPVPWKDAELNPDILIGACRRKDLLEIFIRIYEINAIRKGAKYWFCKSMDNVHYINKFEEYGFKPFYIHLVRDGRDVALSFQKAVVGEKHIYHLAKKWKESQDLSDNFIKYYSPQRAIRIKYEDLLLSPEKEIRKICDLIGLKYSNKILNFYLSEDSLMTASSGDLWQNLTHPLISNNFNKFIKEMPKEELEIFESVAGDTLERFGYQRELDHYLDLKFSHEDLKNFDLENERLKQMFLKTVHSKDLLLRQKQEEIIREIRSRNIVIARQELNSRESQ